MSYDFSNREGVSIGRSPYEAALEWRIGQLEAELKWRRERDDFGVSAVTTDRPAQTITLDQPNTTYLHLIGHAGAKASPSGYHVFANFMRPGEQGWTVGYYADRMDIYRAHDEKAVLHELMMRATNQMVSDAIKEMRK